MKPSRSRDKSVFQSETSEDHLDQPGDASPGTPLAPEERARLLIKLEAEFEAAERSVREEGTISAGEFVKHRADYWAGLTQGSSERDRKARRRR